MLQPCWSYFFQVETGKQEKANDLHVTGRLFLQQFFNHLTHPCQTNSARSANSIVINFSYIFSKDRFDHFILCLFLELVQHSSCRVKTQSGISG